jgi:iron complex outermembrane receptor protein
MTDALRMDQEPRARSAGACSTAAIAIAAAVFLTLNPQRAQAQAAAPDLPLEELLNIDVQTASRKSQRLQDVASAVHVVTREDIERSGATSLPEVLRMVPGMQVARLANNRWAVTARGFNGRFANKLLVLMDGRSIYSPLFSGVMWEAEDVLLEDIERIEVIRGPGAALWGANAVNGVINIITRHARDTRGGLAVVGAGSDERGLLALRQGMSLADGNLRLWAKAFDQQGSQSTSGVPGHDDWRAVRVGFRGDWSFDTTRRLTVSGMAYDGPACDRWLAADVGSPLGYTPVDVDQGNMGGHLLVRHEWLGTEGTQTALQSYVERNGISISPFFEQRRTTADVDFQQRRLLSDRHDLVWGLGWRHSGDDISGQGIVQMSPPSRHWDLASVFLHDEVTLVPQRFKAVLGARLEHNSVTGYELQPNVRGVWTPSPAQTLWAALSGAARTPARAELDVTADLSVVPPTLTTPPVLVRSVPRDNRDLDAERVASLEFGWRQQASPTVSTDLALFRSRYHKLRTAQSIGTSFVPGPTPYVLQTLQPRSSGDATVNGLELAADWRTGATWRWQLAYTFAEMSVHPVTADPVEAAALAEFKRTLPRHQLSLRGGTSLGDHLRIDGWLRSVSALDTTPRVDAYTTLDLRLAWRLAPTLELSLTGHNLLQARHAEFVPDYLPSQAQWVERAYTARLKWQF